MLIHRECVPYLVAQAPLVVSCDSLTVITAARAFGLLAGIIAWEYIGLVRDLGI